MAAGYDIIGDVHGDADALERLLHELEYQERDSTYHHMEGNRQAIFVGDFVDRGHQNARVIQIARSMVEADSAQAIMGNHEFGHIRYATQNENGEYLIPHGKGYGRFMETCLNEFPFGSEAHQDLIDWFKTLPVFIETEDFIVAHASHEGFSIGHLWPYLDDNQVFSESAYTDFTLSEEFHTAMYNVMFGPDVYLPKEVVETLNSREMEEDGRTGYNSRRRVYWWANGKSTPQDVLGLAHIDLSEEQVALLEKAMQERERLSQVLWTPGKPVVFGHYSLVSEPHVTAEKAICVDFKGHLTAYRYDEGDEGEFHDDRFVSVEADEPSL